MPRSATRLVPLAVLLLTLAVAAGCDRFENTPSDAGTFAYTAFGNEGVVLAEGTLDLVFEDDPAAAGATRITGTRRLTLLAEPFQAGPQDGVGPVEGGISPDGQLRLNLSPERTDNDRVVLLAEVEDGDVLRGTWTFVTPTSSVAGAFEARRTAGAGVPNG